MMKAPFDTLRCSGSGASSIICSHEINLLKHSLPELVEGGASIRKTKYVFQKVRMDGENEWRTLTLIRNLWV
jgi:hypothetical protein